MVPMIRKTMKGFVGRLFTTPQPKGPQRLARDVHGIDRRLVSRHAIKVCEVLTREGYDAYIVGGAVRDLIAGLEPTDFDVATNATPEQIRPLFRRARIIGRRFQLRSEERRVGKEGRWRWWGEYVEREEEGSEGERRSRVQRREPDA